jgi:hypothetical protein
LVITRAGIGRQGLFQGQVRVDQFQEFIRDLAPDFKSSEPVPCLVKHVKHVQRDERSRPDHHHPDRWFVKGYDVACGIGHFNRSGCCAGREQ